MQDGISEDVKYGVAFLTGQNNSLFPLVLTVILFRSLGVPLPIAMQKDGMQAPSTSLPFSWESTAQ